MSFRLPGPGRVRSSDRRGLVARSLAIGIVLF